MTSFDVGEGGMGDMIIALWIAEGANHVMPGEVTFLPSCYDPIIRAFGHVIKGADRGLKFGGTSAPYDVEMRSRGLRPKRTDAWQMECPFQVEARRPRFSCEGPVPDYSHDKPLVLLFPWSQQMPRNWPITKWIKLAWELEPHYEVIALHHQEHPDLMVFPKYMWGYPILQVYRLMQAATLVIANDSGSAHVAGTLKTPTLALMGPTQAKAVFGHCPEIIPLTSESFCTGCHFEREKGFSSACDRGCDSLMLLDYRRVLEVAHATIERVRNRCFDHVDSVPAIFGSS